MYLFIDVMFYNPKFPEIHFLAECKFLDEFVLHKSQKILCRIFKDTNRDFELDTRKYFRKVRSANTFKRFPRRLQDVFGKKAKQTKGHQQRFRPKKRKSKT